MIERTTSSQPGTTGALRLEVDVVLIACQCGPCALPCQVAVLRTDIAWQAGLAAGIVPAWPGSPPRSRSLRSSRRARLRA